MVESQQTNSSADSRQPPEEGGPSVAIAMPPEIERLLAKPPLVKGEDLDAYTALFNGLARELKPEDLREWLVVADLTNSRWESQRLRHLLGGIIHIGMIKGARRLLLPLMHPDGSSAVAALGDEAQALVARHLVDDAAATSKLNALLASGGMDADALTAQSFKENFDSMDRIDRMLAAHERRREQLMVEYERRRAATAARRPDVSDAIVIDGQSAGRR